MNTKRSTGVLTLAIASAAALAMAPTRAWANTISWGASGGTAWLTGANWTGNNVPGTTDVAQFGTNPSTATSIGINMGGATNNGTNNKAVGAIEVTVARTRGGVGIGDSSSSTNGTLTLNGATVNSVNDVILRNGSKNVDLTLKPTTSTGIMTVALADATDNVVSIDDVRNVIISANITGTGKHITVGGAGTGQLRLSGANSFTGGITVNSATELRLDATTAVPSTGAIAINSGALLEFSVGGTFGAVGQNLTFTPNQTAAPSLDQSTTNINVVWQGNLALAADTQMQVNGASGILEFSGTYSGAGTLIKQATGTLTLSGSGNTATGGTVVGNGALIVASGSLLGTGAITMAQTSGSNTALTFNNAAQTIGTLSSTFTNTTGTHSQIITLNGTALTINQAANATYGTGAASTLTSTIAGTGSITLGTSSTSKLTLNGQNTYQGGTTINGGTLVAASNGALGTGNVNIAGGTLEIDPASVGGLGSFSLSTGTLQVDPGTLAADISSGVLAGSGSFTIIGGTINLGLSGDNTFDYTQQYQLLNFTGGGLASGETFTNYDTGDYTASLNSSGVLRFAPTTVPEPASLGLLALGGLALLKRRRK